VTEVLDAIPDSLRLHILGFSRIDSLSDFAGLRIHSFDSSSPMLRAFKDDRHNYFDPDGHHYVAIRIPSLHETSVQQKIGSGKWNADQASKLEQNALEAVRQYGRRRLALRDTLQRLSAHHEFFFGAAKTVELYRRTLEQRPWENCECRVCQSIGIEAIIFRGLNRNKRRGFHNLHVFHAKLKKVRQMKSIDVPCIKLQQTKSTALYSFVVNGKDFSKFTSVSRIARNDQKGLIGYQRPEVNDHISEIREYLDRSDAILPNSIVVAFDGAVQFLEKEAVDDRRAVGVLRISIEGAHRPAWIVDGQQRVAALRQLPDSNFPVSVVGFVSSGVDMEREQFLLVNNTRPLPKSLLYELLPSIGNSVPARLRKRQAAYRILEQLNTMPLSPFYERIATRTSRHVSSANIRDVSVLKMIENSSECGMLQEVGAETKAAVKWLLNYWNAVREVFPEAWGLSPRKSRLTHGAGIVSMGYLMDAIGYSLADAYRIPPKEAIRSELERVGTSLAWTSGNWRFGKDFVLPWNEIQNTSRHIDMLANFLIRRYSHARRKRCKEASTHH